MKSIKISALVVATLFVANAFGQQGKAESVTNSRQSAKRTAVRADQKLEYAQVEKVTPEQLAQKQTDELDKIVTLTQDQRNKIFETNVFINNKNEAVNVHPTWTAEIKKEAFEGNNAGRDGLIKNYLTPEQIALWETAKASSAVQK